MVKVKGQRLSLLKQGLYFCGSTFTVAAGLVRSQKLVRNYIREKIYIVCHAGMALICGEEEEAGTLRYLL